jgi:hypothetical protein
MKKYSEIEIEIIAIEEDIITGSDGIIEGSYELPGVDFDDNW